MALFMVPDSTREMSPAVYAQRGLDAKFGLYAAGAAAAIQADVKLRAK
jgi:hypothetical protein